MVSRLIKDVGYGWAMRISAFLMLFLLIIANMTIRDHHPPQPNKVTRAQLVKPFAEPQFVLVAAGLFCFSYGVFVPINYLPAQATAVGMDPNLVQYLIPILNAASLFGRLGAGIVADKVGRYNVFIVVCYMSGIWILVLWLADTSNAALIAFAVLFGFFSGAYVSLVTPLVMQISPIAELGFRIGVALFVSSIAGLTTNPINGAILDHAGGWNGLKIFSGVFCLVGTTVVLLARMRATSWKLAVRF
jgi:MFS family permease